jgi:hypothetical protein
VRTVFDGRNHPANSCSRALAVASPLRRNSDKSARRQERISCRFSWRATEFGSNHGFAGVFLIIQTGNLVYF